MFAINSQAKKPTPDLEANLWQVLVREQDIKNHIVDAVALVISRLQVA